MSIKDTTLQLVMDNLEKALNDLAAVDRGGIFTELETAHYVITRKKKP